MYKIDSPTGFVEQPIFFTTSLLEVNDNLKLI